MQIAKAESLQAGPGPADWFTGEVTVTAMFQPTEPARAACGKVTFPPSARTHWHTHPLGQTLIILNGRGLIQVEGHPAQEFKAGDVVNIAPGEKHWHGAGPDEPMTHLAIQEREHGIFVQWLEPVTDDQYRGR